MVTETQYALLSHVDYDDTHGVDVEEKKNRFIYKRLHIYLFFLSF